MPLFQGCFTISLSGNPSSWNFKEASPAYLVHGLHPYPARMHPLIARNLIERFRSKNTQIADPFCGSGTILVESLLAGLDSFGVDLNPLACVITKAKITVVNPAQLERVREWTNRRVSRKNLESHRSKLVSSRKRFFHFWFKPRILQDLLAVRNVIVASDLWHSSCRWMLAACLSRTIRAVSNQRPFEFKSYRLSFQALEKHNPDVLVTFHRFLNDSIARQERFFDCLPRNAQIGKARAEVIQADSRLFQIRRGIDLVITSPPYGDSDTTVAYEQFSKLPLRVLGEDSDEFNLARVPRAKRGPLGDYPSMRASMRISSKIKRIDPARAQVLDQYLESLWRSISSISYLLKKNGVACIVMGPRTVCGVRVPTPTILEEFARELSLEMLARIPRGIPRKVLPRRNNRSGTINSEVILVYTKGR